MYCNNSSGYINNGICSYYFIVFRYFTPLYIIFNWGGIGIFAIFGLFLMILGIRMGLRGALDEFEEFVKEVIEGNEEQKMG